MASYRCPVMSHSLFHPFSFDFGDISCSAWSLSLHKQAITLSSPLVSFLPQCSLFFPPLLFCQFHSLSLHSSRKHRLPSTYLWPRILFAGFHPGTHFSLGYLIDTEAKLCSLHFTAIPAAFLSFIYSVGGKYALCFLTFFSAYIRKSLCL